MASAINKALSRHQAVLNSATSLALRMKQAGVGDVFVPSSFSNTYEDYKNQSVNKRRYSQFRGWVHAAVHALAKEAAAQEVKAGRLAGKGKPKGKKSRRHERFSNHFIKDHQRCRMAKSIRSKAAEQEVEILADHDILKSLNKPNSAQYKWQFVYSFVANLCLTGVGYIVGGKGEDDELEFFSVPTNWITPKHEKGLFSEFVLRNPNKPGEKGETLSGDQVAFALLPHPENPFLPFPLAQAQSTAIQIDSNIQQSQLVFFDNGMFPSVIITMGKMPLPEGGEGPRPILTGAQRRQIYGAIRKITGGIANYGNPAIIDGLIEKIDRLSMTQNELGWEKSEKTVRTRILSAFGVHPFILGEEMAGSYAQAYIVQEVFNKNVNSFLDLLSIIMSEFSSRITEEEDLLVWWEESHAKDPSMEKSLWEGARGRNDITQNEFRSWMGLPPDEDKNESVIDKSLLTGVISVAGQVKEGKLTPEQGRAILVGLGLPDNVAEEVAGEGPSEEDKQAALQQANQGLEQAQGQFGDFGFDQETQETEKIISMSTGLLVK